MNEHVQVEMHFPPGFLWGTATAAHQVEGGNCNNWSAWEDQGGGRIFGDHVSGAACNWWADGQAEADFARAAGMGNNALRLSVEWSRIESEPGCWDTTALERYSAMIDALLARGLTPMVTLHHFTNPLWLEARGGWLHPDTPQHFARFAARVAEALGDRVTLWCTINEPMVYSVISYLDGRWPPGHSNLGEAMQVVAGLVRGHAAAYRAIKAVQPGAQIGFAKHQISFAAGTPVIGHLGAWALNYLFNEAIFGPFNGKPLRLPGLTVDIPAAQDTLDWIGLQYYARQYVYLKPGGEYLGVLGMGVPEGRPRGPEAWGELAPEQAFRRITHLYRLVRRPVYITEMGLPDADDSLRPAYLARTLHAVWKACMHSYPVRGFFFWSLVDNFEWAEGYDPRYRFGLHGVDFATQAREERRSARLYRAVCAANALTAAIVRDHAPEVFAELFPVPAIDDGR
ncbi:MAG: family 1 glycosylhydrolase [Anaerolineae bacterium]|nr:family 1 glycosylhydrolase [Anaerolineae bacterium]